MKIKAVLHKSYGGFHLNQDIVDGLNKYGFIWEEFSAELPQKSCGFIYWDKMDEFRFRSHPIFIKVVEELKIENDKLDRYKSRKNYISNLEIVEVNLNVEIVDYDGIECLAINGREIYS